MDKKVEQFLQKYGMHCWLEIDKMFKEEYQEHYRSDKKQMVEQMMNLILVESDIKEPQVFLRKMGLDLTAFGDIEAFFNKVKMDFYFTGNNEGTRMEVELYGVRFKEEEKSSVEEDEIFGVTEDYLFNLPKRINHQQELFRFFKQLRIEITKKADSKYGQ